MGKRDIHEKEPKQSKFQWFLIVILIPSLFALTFILVILTIADVNVLQAAKQIGAKVPLVSSLVVDHDKTKPKDVESEISNLQGKIKDKETKIKDLQANVETKDAEISQLNAEINQLHEQLTEKQQEIQDETKRKKAVTTMYETMSSKDAAAIITKLEDTAAVTILSSVSEEKAADILAKMEAEMAAKYTELLTTNHP